MLISDYIRRIQQKRYGVSATELHKKTRLINSQYGVSLLSTYVIEQSMLVMNPTSAGMRHHRPHLYVDSKSLDIGFPAQSVGSSNTYVLDLPCLLVLIIRTSQSRQHVDTSLIHIESRKSPTAMLFDDDTGRISIRHCEY
ncbi:hypothetical protein Tco_1225247 [Tanacetum coccineum]